MLSVCLVGGPPWGFRLSQTEGQSPHVSQVLPGGRADVERMRVGDVIETINGEECHDSAEAYHKLRSANSGLLVLKIRRTAQSEPQCSTPSIVQSPLTIAGAPGTCGVQSQRQRLSDLPQIPSSKPYTGGSLGSALEKRRYFEDIAARQLANPKHPKIRPCADVETCDQKTDISGYDSVGGDFAGGPLLSTTTATNSERLTPLSSVDTTQDDVEWGVEWPSTPTKRTSPEDDLLRLGLLPSLVQLSPSLINSAAPLNSQEIMSVAPPPPPPPPPPSSKTQLPVRQWKLKTGDGATGGAEGSVEIPEKQSVAQLRDQIATKLEVKTPSGARPMTAVVHNHPPQLQRSCITPVPFERAVLTNGTNGIGGISSYVDEAPMNGIQTQQYDREQTATPPGCTVQSATLSRSNSRVFSPVMHRASLRSSGERPPKAVADLVQPDYLGQMFGPDNGGVSIIRTEQRWTTSSPAPWGQQRQQYTEGTDQPVLNGNHVSHDISSSQSRWDMPFTEQSSWYKDMHKRLHNLHEQEFPQMLPHGREASPGSFVNNETRPWTPFGTSAQQASVNQYRPENARRSKSVGRMEIASTRCDDADLVARWAEQKRQLNQAPQTNGFGRPEHGLKNLQPDSPTNHRFAYERMKATVPHFHLPSYRFVHEDPRPLWCDYSQCMRCGLPRHYSWFNCDSLNLTIDEKAATERLKRLRIMEIVKRTQIKKRLADTAAHIQDEIEHLERLGSRSSLEPSSSNSSTDIPNCSLNSDQHDSQPSQLTTSQEAETSALHREIGDLKRRTHDDLIKKQKSDKLSDELNDQKNRRHGFIPNATPALQNNFERFEGLINEYDRSATPSSRSFDGMSARELSFNRGDVIRVTRQVDGNWIEGERNGKSGIFPANYVQMSDPVAVDRVRALFPFFARNRNELNLKKGEVIELLRSVDNNWSEGKNHRGEIGIFPKCYVEQCHHEESELSSDRIIPDRPKTPKFTSTIMREESPAPGRKNDHVQDVQAWEQHRSAQGLFGPAHIVPKNAETFRAVYPYEPKNADELELRPNDIVFVVEKCDDGWYIGTLLRTGQFGTFPGNYVERH